MKQIDYAFLIFEGIFDYPNFLEDHLRRKAKDADDKGYTLQEFEHELREVLSQLKNKFQEAYSKDLETYEKYKKVDKSLPEGNKHNYPKPDLEKLTLKRIYLANISTFDLPIPIKLQDVVNVETAFDNLIKQQFDLNTEDRLEAIESTDDIISWLHQLDRKNFTQLIEGWKKLEEYIHKNVFEDVRADLPRLKQLNRNLTNWQYQIRSVYIEPIEDHIPYFSDHLNQAKDKALARLVNKVTGALEVLALRIKDKETTPSQTGAEKPVEGNNLFCKSMPLEIAKKHFQVFAEKVSRNGKTFLSQQELNLFIEKAFGGNNTIPKQTFNIAPQKEKLFIVKRFYEFYCIAVKDYENTSQCKEKYIKLLTDNFTNWDYENIKNNFGNKVKREW